MDTAHGGRLAEAARASALSSRALPAIAGTESSHKRLILSSSLPASTVESDASVSSRQRESMSSHSGVRLLDDFDSNKTARANSTPNRRQAAERVAVGAS